jgi:uncharacterized protein YcfJ
MKNMILGAAMAAALGAGVNTASAQNTYGDTARVLQVTPIVERASSPRRECYTEPVTSYEEPRPAPPVSGGIGPGTVLGAIAGGVIGHQFNNNSAGSTAAGAVIGGIVGNQVDRNAQATANDVYVERAPTTRDVERCKTVPDTRERIVGYDVQYEYNGHPFRTRLPYDPGSQLPVNVEVRPPGADLAPGGPRRPTYRGTY